MANTKKIKYLIINC